jgi:hypothetical protein
VWHRIWSRSWRSVGIVDVGVRNGVETGIGVGVVKLVRLLALKWGQDLVLGMVLEYGVGAEVEAGVGANAELKARWCWGWGNG